MASAINSPTRTLTNVQDSNLATILDIEQCPRCGGLLVSEWCLDLLDDTGQFDFAARRCVQCGEVLDPVILQNRLRQQPIQCSPERQGVEAPRTQW